MPRKSKTPGRSVQLELPLSKSAAPKLRLIAGEGRRTREKLHSREAVVRVLVEAGADLLLHRISPERASAIQRAVDQVLKLFDAVDGTPALLPVLRREIAALEELMTQTRALRMR